MQGLLSDHTITHSFKVSHTLNTPSTSNTHYVFFLLQPMSGNSIVQAMTSNLIISENHQECI